MITLSDIKTEVGKIALKSGLQSRIPLWAHFVELDIFSRYPFWTRVKNATLNMVASQATYTLSPRVEGRRVSKLNDTTNDRHINIEELANQLWSDPTPDETGDPFAFAFMGLSKVQNQPTAASALSLVSTSASDTTQKVLIRGTVGGVEVYEEKTLNGITPVVSAFSYSEFESIQKSATTIGTVSGTTNAGAVTNIVLAPQDIAMECPLIRMRLVPSATATMRYWFYEKVRRMTNDYDIPMIPEPFQWKTLMNGVLEIAHLNNQDYEQANMYGARMEKGIIELVDWASPHGYVKPKSRGSGSRTLRDMMEGGARALDSFGVP